jgi:hypothetical protein
VLVQRQYHLPASDIPGSSQVTEIPCKWPVPLQFQELALYAPKITRLRTVCRGLRHTPARDICLISNPLCIQECKISRTEVDLDKISVSPSLLLSFLPRRLKTRGTPDIVNFQDCPHCSDVSLARAVCSMLNCTRGADPIAS